MKDYKELIAQHEALKLKGLRLTEQDLFDWVMLWENMLDATTESKSVYQEAKQQNEVSEGIRFLKLQSDKIESVDKKGEKTYKNMYTVDGAKYVLAQEFEKERNNIKVLGLIPEQLKNKTTVIGEYINLVKMTMKR